MYRLAVITKKKSDGINICFFFFFSRNNLNFELITKLSENCLLKQISSIFFLTFF